MRVCRNAAAHLFLCEAVCFLRPRLRAAARFVRRGGVFYAAIVFVIRPVRRTFIGTA